VILPDDKDWTWVLDRACPECGYDAAAVERERLGALTRGAAESWLRVLDRSDVRQRPSGDRWSPLEYACHVRDVFEIFDVRVGLMLSEEDPLFANWDQDATAQERDYGSQDPARVSVELAESARALAGRFDGVSGPQWTRPGTRSNGSRFSVESIGRYMAHDILHHLWDVGHPPVAPYQ